MSDTLESLQRTAMRTIFGAKVSYRNALATANISTLKDRREEAFKNFALKIQKNPRFVKDWLAENDKNGWTLRTSEKYLIRKPNFDRLRLGPLNQLRSILNNL